MHVRVWRLVLFFFFCQSPINVVEFQQQNAWGHPRLGNGQLPFHFCLVHWCVYSSTIKFLLGFIPSRFLVFLIPEACNAFNATIVCLCVLCDVLLIAGLWGLQ